MLAVQRTTPDTKWIWCSTLIDLAHAIQLLLAWLNPYVLRRTFLPGAEAARAQIGVVGAGNFGGFSR